MPCVNDMPTDIKKYLKSAGITQKQFAEKMNLSRPTLNTYIEMYEHGRTLPKKKYDDYFNKLFKATNNSPQMFISELQKIEFRDGNSAYCRLDNSLESDAEDYISLIVRNMRKDFETEGWNRNIYTFINILISDYRKNDFFQYLAEYFVYFNSIEDVENISSKQIPYFANMFKTFCSLSENPENYDQQDYKDFIKRCKEIRDSKKKEYNKREDSIKGEIRHILLSYERKGVNLSDQEILEKLTTHLSQIPKKEKKSMNNIIITGWKNKSGTKDRQCKCGSWKIHWMNYSGQKWPEKCSVQGCSNAAEVGAHVYNNEVTGEQIIPACKACNQRTDSFSLKYGTILVPANKQKTCE